MPDMPPRAAGRLLHEAERYSKNQTGAIFMPLTSVNRLHHHMSQDLTMRQWNFDCARHSKLMNCIHSKS